MNATTEPLTPYGEWDELDAAKKWEAFQSRERTIEVMRDKLDRAQKELDAANANKRYGWDTARESDNALRKVVQERNATIAELEGVAAHRDSLMMECASLRETLISIRNAHA